MVFGVAGGMADWLDADPAVVRLVWVLLILAGGVGLVLYLVAAIVVPEEPLGLPASPTETSASPEGNAQTDQSRWEARQARRAARRAAREGRTGSAGIVIGVMLVFAGAWFLLQRYIPAFDSADVFPGLLIILGVALLVGAVSRAGSGNTKAG